MPTLMCQAFLYGVVPVKATVTVTNEYLGKSDINKDGRVDMRDIGIVAAAHGSVPGDPNWNQEADINGDDIVDDKDLDIVRAMFGALPLVEETPFTVKVFHGPTVLQAEYQKQKLQVTALMPEGKKRRVVFVVSKFGVFGRGIVLRPRPIPTA